MDKTRMQDALVKAHEAGDTEAANVIAQEIKTRFPKAQARSMPPAKSDPVLSGYSPFIETVKDLPGHVGRAITGFGSGIMDLPVGAGQLVSEGAGVLGATGFRDRFRNYQQQREQEIATDRGEYSDRANIGRGTGGVFSAMALGGSNLAPTLGARMVQGAKMGGGLGLASPTPGDPNDFWLGKALQVGGGSVIGAAAQPVAELVVRGAGAAVNRVADAFRGTANRVAGATPQQIETTLRLELQNAGVDWNALNGQYRQAILSEVQNAVSRGGQLNPDAIRRLADFERVGAVPLQGQLSRNPAEFAREQNLARTAQGGPIAERIGQQNQAFIGNLPAAEPYATGRRAIASLTARDAPREAAVSARYNEARDHLGRAAPMDAYGFSQAANRALDDQMLGAYLPAEVRNTLNQVSRGEIPFNVNTAVQMDRVLSAAQRAAGEGTPQALAIGQVRNSLNSAGIADNVGADAKAVFDAARGMARSRFQNIERTPALGSALDETVPPERFVEQFAVRGSVNDVANMMRNLTNEGRQATRQGVIDWIRQRAVSGEGDTAKFSQSGFNRALQAIGDRKLELLFAGDRQQLQTLRALGRASATAMVPPPASGVNYSGSGTTILDAIDRAAALPFPLNVLGRPGDIVRAHQATAALTPAPVTPALPILSPDLLGQFARPLGVLGPAMGATVPGALLSPY